MGTFHPRVTRIKVVLVIPCYNEEQRFRSAEFQKFLTTSEVELVFVNDGSSDGTGELLERFREGAGERVSILHLKQNQGKGEAVRQGVLLAVKRNADYVGFWDADLATPLEAVSDFMEVFREQPHLDIVFGSRVKLLGRKVERRPIRHYLGRLFATVVSCVLRLPVYDTQCGAKLFRIRPNTEKLFSQRFQSRWVFDVELIARYIQESGSPGAAAARIYEYPLHRWEDVHGSKVKAIDFLVALGDVAQIYWKYLHSPQTESGQTAGQAPTIATKNPLTGGPK